MLMKLLIIWIVYMIFKKYFADLEIRKPDFVFDFDLFEPNYAEAMGEKVPIHESRKNNQYLKGCYAFIDPGFIWHGLQVIYIGKAVRLRNRISGYYFGRDNHSRKVMDEYWKLVGEDDDVYTGCLYVAIWLSNQRNSLEAELIYKLNPILNEVMNP